MRRLIQDASFTAVHPQERSTSIADDALGGVGCLVYEDELGYVTANLTVFLRQADGTDSSHSYAMPPRRALAETHTGEDGKRQLRCTVGGAGDRFWATFATPGGPDMTLELTLLLPHHPGEPCLTVKMGGTWEVQLNAPERKPKEDGLSERKPEE